MNTCHNNVNFSATYIPYKQNIPVSKVIDSVAPYFQLKGFANCEAKAIRNKINLSQAGMGMDKNGLILVGKDREADKFISRMVSENGIKSKYVEDTPVTDFSSSKIDLSI